MLQDKKVAVVGLGVMGRALVSGLVGAEAVAPESIFVASRSRSSLESLRGEFPVKGFADADDALRGADVAVLCVKPKDVEKAVSGLSQRGALDHAPLLVSIAAGVSTGFIEGLCPKGVPVVRAMPNTPCSIGKGMTVVSKGSSATDEHIALASEVFATMGRVTELDEKHMDTVTGLSASGCAFIYLIVEALADGGVMRGLPRKTATELVAQMTLGAAEMVLASGRHPASLKDDVTTPAGCTIAGILALEDGKIRSVLARAVETASRVAGELGK
jgi:pyrroline-5-carboxylate reductase